MIISQAFAGDGAALSPDKIRELAQQQLGEQVVTEIGILIVLIVVVIVGCVWFRDRRPK